MSQMGQMNKQRGKHEIIQNSPREDKKEGEKEDRNG